MGTFLFNLIDERDSWSLQDTEEPSEVVTYIVSFNCSGGRKNLFDFDPWIFIWWVNIVLLRVYLFELMGIIKDNWPIRKSCTTIL